ncbi:MAG: class D sortase [Bryobacterales bacterium]|nr:class D sortase [Bryobacterales bacterium]
MKLVANKRSLLQFLRWAQRALFAGGLLALGYCGFVLIDSWLFQQRASEELERRLGSERAGRSASEQPVALPPAIGADGLIGRLQVQRLGLSAIVFENTDRKTLRRATGHIPRTGFPGEPGNIGIAGHRDSFFRPLKDIAKEDVITLTTLRGEFRYRVVSMRVVAPTEVSVLNPTANEVLTLVTCYPFYFVGSAPERFIVRAERVM